MTPIDGNDTSQPNFTPCVRTVHADECYQLPYVKCQASQVSYKHRVSIERKCPYMKKSKGEGNFPYHFDNNDVT